MRGPDTYTESLFSVLKLDDFIPANHPLRPIRQMVNLALTKMDALFSSMYEADIKGGRPSIAPEKLLRALLLQVFYSIRSERHLMEQTQYNLLYRWFIGLAMEDSIWVPTVFSKNRDRLLEHDTVIALFNEILAQAEQQDLLSGEHFSVDGTLIQAWAGHKSFVPKDSLNPDTPHTDGGNAPTPDGKDSTLSAAPATATTATPASTSATPSSTTTTSVAVPEHFKGQTRSNDTHVSKTDADARLYCKGDNASRLRYMGHTLADNRHGLIASAMVTTADGHAEREAAKAMINDARQVIATPKGDITLGADKGYDAAEFIDACLEMNVTPHVAQNTSGRKSAVPQSIADSVGYAISMNKRKLIEQGFGWAKTIGRMRQVMVRGLKRVDQMFVLTMTAYNLTRMRTLGQLRLQTAQGAGNA